MTTQQKSAEKILRIGVIHGGKIVEERLLKKREVVSVGSDPKNTFVLPGADIPKSVKLFDCKGAIYTLCFTDKMDGRLSVNESVIDFAGLKSQNLATKTGDTYRINLTDSSRGKVQVGDVTLLFQFVVPPPVAPKATLPAVARGGIIKGMDPLFSGLMIGSIVFHFGSAAFLSTVDPPPPPTLEDVGERFAKYIAPDITKLKPPPKVEEKVADAPAEKKAEKKQDDGKKAEKKDSGAKKAQDSAARKAAIQKAVASKGLLKVLGARGGGGAFADVFSNSGPGQGLGELLSQSGGVGIAKEGDGALSGPRGAGSGTGAADIGTLNTAGGGGGGGAAVGAKSAVQVRGEVKATNVEEVDGSLDPKVITKTIRARMAGFKACYENALKRSPNLQGKVTISFTIDEEGRVSEASVENDTLGDPEVGRCIANLFKRIRFPKPDEGTVQASFPFVFVPSG
ncbi:MAG: AgmX/PglI C-terminal domain-containing protein [Myxococcota bacterium]